MYNGKTQFSPGGRVVVNRRTGVIGPQLSGLGMSPGEAAYENKYGRVTNNPTDAAWKSPGWPTSETNPTSYGREVSNSPYKPTEYDDMQVIEVSGTRIPWWVWAAGGLMGFAALNHFVKR